jgi:peptide/nickel transport system substrate-binding protein
LLLAARVYSGVALGLMLATAPAVAQSPPSGQPRVGGTLRFGVWSEPTTLNPYYSNSRPNQALAELTFDGLAHGAPDGSYLPGLAAEVPTQANGDVSADGTVVTWKLKPGVTWSDGQPFTSHDVVFTYQMLMDPANPVLNRGDYAVMDSLTAPDDNTLVVTYKQLYAPYRLAFPYVFPAHAFNGQTNIAQDPFNRAPSVATGPFVVRSWASGDSITFDRNPNYREAGKPYLDQVIVKFTPSRDAEIQTLEAGDLDVAWFLDESYLRQLATLSDVSVEPVQGPTSGVENLYLNLSCSSGLQQGDPTCPNPVLGDLRVRQAIDLAVDKQAIVRGFLADRVKIAGSVLPSPYAPDLPPSEFSPNKARQLLDQAGWVVGSDGIRAKGGVRAHLMLFTATGSTITEEIAQVIEGNLLDIGIETEGKQSPVILASIFFLGSFDLAVFGGTLGIDPQSYLYSHYGSDQVPNPQLMSGSNYDRIQDAELDQALAAAGSTVDDAQRKLAYTAAAELIHADEAVIPLYQALQVDARKNIVQGWQGNGNDTVTWNIQDWWLNQ